MNNDITLRDRALISIVGDTEAVLCVANTMAKHFHFDDEAMSIRYGDNDCAEVRGIVDGKRIKKYRKKARVRLFDITIDD